MEQWIEGIGNEVTACFVLLSSLLAYSIYKFVNTWHPTSTIQNVPQQSHTQDLTSEVCIICTVNLRM